jgi:DNA-binding IclR family transcriptional regulator
MPNELNHIRSVDRAISVLKIFTARRFELSGAEVARQVGLSVTTTHRLLKSLCQNGFLSRNEKTLKFSIGSEMFRIGNLFLLSSDLVTVLTPIVRQLNEMTNESISISVRDEDYITIIMREESKFSVGLHLHIGSILPAHATSVGKALLSELSDTQVDHLYPDESFRIVTPKTIRTRTQLKQELERIRASGVAFSREEAFQGDIAIASLIRDATGKAIAAIAIGVPVFRMNKKKEAVITKLVVLAADLISYRLGYQGKHIQHTDFAGIRAWWEQQQDIMREQ